MIESRPEQAQDSFNLIHWIPPGRFRAEAGMAVGWLWFGSGKDVGSAAEMGISRSLGGLPWRRFSAIIARMVTLAEIESLAFKLPKSDRAKLAADLLDSLPGVLDDEDEGIAEAMRRSEEMNRDPSVCLTHDEFLKALGRKP